MNEDRYKNIAENIRESIGVVPDFPIEGIQFYDIAILLALPDLWTNIIEAMAEKAQMYRPSVIAGLESRGFLMGVPLALKLGLPFAMIRKKGKLPGATWAQSYDLEYGSAEIEIQKQACGKGDRVLLVDDLLATGGTMAAAVKLIRETQADPVGSLCVIELEGLNGRDKLNAVSCSFESLVSLPVEGIY